MIRISQLKLPVDHGPEDLKRQAAKELKVPEERIESLAVSKKSIDARKKPVVMSILWMWSFRGNRSC